jgi:putative membrane protein
MLLAGVVMMLLDVVIDPLAVRGDRWFLGRIFTYPAGGVYFGVPVSNFAGWAVVGWVIVGGYAWATRGGGDGGGQGPRRSPGPGVALYYGVLLFNLAMTLWIGEWRLLVVGILVHAVTYLLLYAVSAGRGRLRVGRRAGPRSGKAGVPS